MVKKAERGIVESLSIESLAAPTDEIIQQIESRLDQPQTEDGESMFDITTTGIDMLDLCGGGFLWGKIVNIVGDKSSGKSALASEFIYALHKIYGNKLKWFYDDAEAGYSFNSQKMWGLDIVADDADCSDTLEDFQDNLDKELDNLKDDEYFVYVLDSFDGLTTDDEIEHYEEVKKARAKGKEASGSYGMSKAKGSSQFFRMMKRKIKNKKCLLIILSQIRDKINVSFGVRYVRTGGRALDFYSSQIFLLAETEQHEKLGRTTGITIKAKNTKNKIAPPFRTCYIELIFDYGIDNIMSNLIFLYDLKTETGKNVEKINKKVLIWDGSELTLKQLIRHIEDDNLEEELKKRCKDKWLDIEKRASASEGRKKKF